MSKQIFVITRRFKKGETLPKTKKYPIADISKDDSANPCINDTDSLASFWVRQLIEKLDDFKRKKANEIKEFDLTSFFDVELDMTDEFENIISGEDIKFLKQEFIKYLFTEFNKTLNSNLTITENFLSHIHQLQNKEGNNTLIFIYHHWLDKQNLDGDKKNDFLINLRKEIVRILSVLKVDYSINWLVHDSDILNNNYDGLLWFDENYEQVTSKTSYHATLSHDDLTQLIPKELQKDNIWCFVHQVELDSYYSNVILRSNSNYCQSAENLYKYLLLDKEGISRRWKTLRLFDINVNSITGADLAFLLNTSLDQLDNKIKMINTLENNSITISDGYFNLSKLIS